MLDLTTCLERSCGQGDIHYHNGKATCKHCHRGTSETAHRIAILFMSVADELTTDQQRAIGAELLRRGETEMVCPLAPQGAEYAPSVEILEGASGRLGLDTDHLYLLLSGQQSGLVFYEAVDLRNLITTGGGLDGLIEVEANWPTNRDTLSIATIKFAKTLRIGRNRVSHIKVRARDLVEAIDKVL